jgi:hypothetical protein
MPEFSLETNHIIGEIALNKTSALHGNFRLMRLLCRQYCSCINNFDVLLKRVESKIFKKHDKPMTPYQRLMSTNHMPDSKKKDIFYNVSYVR